MTTWTHAIATGTSATANITWATTSGTTSAWDMHVPSPPPKTRVAPVVRNPFVGERFWDGVEWKEYTSYIPRKSITGKIIIGKMHRRIKHVHKIEGTTHRQFAKTKELFEGKLKGNA